MVKNPPANKKTRIQSLNQEDPLEKEMATHSSILAWEVPWTEESGEQQPTPVFLPGESLGQRTLVGYGPQGHKESDTTEAT